MKNYLLLSFFLLSVFSFAHNTDSLSYYKSKTTGLETELMQIKKASSQLKQECDSLLKSELEAQENFYKARIDKLQTLLIGAVASSVLVIGLAFYMLNKKKSQAKK